MKIKSRVYIDLELRNNQIIIPSSEIQHYLIRVLRCNLNDFFSVFNGNEEWITKVSKEHSTSMHQSLQELQV